MSITKDKILIGSTSFLIPHNSSWDELNKAYKCKFAEIGDYKEIFSIDNYNQILCFVVFFEDIIQDKYKYNSKKFIMNKFKHLFRLIENRLKNCDKQFILSFSSEISDNFIKFSKSHDDSDNNNMIIQKLEKFKKKYSHFYFLNFNNLLFKIGTINSFDYRNWYFAKCRLSTEALDLLSNSLHKIIYRFYTPPAKVLVLDCDNTLWGGVIGEDGLNNIELGQDGIGMAFVDFQKIAKKISAEGTILCLCSKNNEKDVWEVFKRHKNMVLNKKDITVAKINWKNKAENILEISKELNLGLQSFVFWDDNPMERNIVKKSLPEVNVVDVDDDVSNWPKQLNESYEFFKFFTTKEDLKKKKQYALMSKFVTKKSENFDEIKYLKSIRLKPKLVKINLSNISRAEQLCLKTNQFNLRNIRYTQFDLSKKIKSKDYILELTNLKDDFGDHGLTGLYIVKKLNHESYLVDNLMLSCRVFGRYLENWMFFKIVNQVKKLGGKYIILEYRKSNKNQIALDFIKKNNFKSYNHKINKLKINNKYQNNFETKNLFIFDITKDKIGKLEIFKEIK